MRQPEDGFLGFYPERLPAFPKALVWPELRCGTGEIATVRKEALFLLCGLSLSPYLCNDPADYKARERRDERNDSFVYGRCIDDGGYGEPEE